MLTVTFSTGHEKLIRLYDLEKPESAPEVLPVAPDRIRSAAFLQNDQLLLSSYIDKPGVRSAPSLACLLECLCLETTSLPANWTEREGRLFRPHETRKLFASYHRPLKFEQLKRPSSKVGLSRIVSEKRD